MFLRRRMQPLSMGGPVMSIHIFNPPRSNHHLASKEAVVVNVDFHHVLTIECQNSSEHKPMTLMFHMFDPKITIIGSPSHIAATCYTRRFLSCTQSFYSLDTKHKGNCWLIFSGSFQTFWDLSRFISFWNTSHFLSPSTQYYTPQCPIKLLPFTRHGSWPSAVTIVVLTSCYQQSSPSKHLESK